jgi:hypothetical protein
MRTAQTGLFAIAIIVAVVIGFIFALLTAWELLYNNGMIKCCEKTCVKWTGALKWKKCIDITLKLINAIFLIIAIVVSSKTKTFFSDLSEASCSDTATNTMLSQFSTQVKEFVYQKNLYAIIVFGIMMFVEILKLLYETLCAKKSKDNKDASTK